MEFLSLFNPPRRTGIIFHGILVAVLLVSGIFSIWFALNRAVEDDIVVWLLAGIILLAPVILFVYRAYSLLQARYLLDRDGLRIRWGLRSEDISMTDIEWIRPASELGYKLHLPFPRWPGSLYGRRETEGLGTVEFIASDDKNLLLIASSKKVYAISPVETSRFLNSFRRAIELGSLTPLSSSTTLPMAYFKRIWVDKNARRLVFAGALAVGILAVAASVSVSAQTELSIGFDPSGQPFPPGPSQYLLLLPILGTMVYVFDLLYGMLLYRRKESQIMAYFLWGTSILTSILLLAGILTAAL